MHHVVTGIGDRPTRERPSLDSDESIVPVRVVDDVCHLGHTYKGMSNDGLTCTQLADGGVWRRLDRFRHKLSHPGDHLRAV